MRQRGPTAKNAFALLREEAAVLKQKEKKERALERKARKEAEADAAAAIAVAAVPIPVATEFSSGRWADFVDDDDDDDENPTAAAKAALPEEEDNLGNYLSSSEDEVKSSDGEEPGEKDENHHVGESTSIAESQDSEYLSKNRQERTIETKKASSNQEKLDIHQSGKFLSKKEKHKQELADLESLLSNFGLTPETLDASSQLEPTGKASLDETNPAASTIIPNSSKSKKKKKKCENEQAEGQQQQQPTSIAHEVKEEEYEQEGALSRNEALAKLKAVAKRKKKPAANNIVTATVLEEAKKKSEVKKAKQRKDKDKLIFRPV